MGFLYQLFLFNYDRKLHLSCFVDIACIRSMVLLVASNEILLHLPIMNRAVYFLCVLIGFKALYSRPMIRHKEVFALQNNNLFYFIVNYLFCACKVHEFDVLQSLKTVFYDILKQDIGYLISKIKCTFHTVCYSCRFSLGDPNSIIC